MTTQDPAPLESPAFSTSTEPVSMSMSSRVSIRPVVLAPTGCWIAFRCSLVVGWIRLSTLRLGALILIRSFALHSPQRRRTRPESSRSS